MNDEAVGSTSEQQTTTGVEQQAGTTPDQTSAQGTDATLEQTAAQEAEKAKREDTTPPGLKRELAELRRRARDAEARAERESAERAQLMQRVLTGNQPAAQQGDGRPDPSKYAGGEFNPEYVEALTEYKARNVVRAQFEEMSKAQRAAAEKQQAQARVDAWNKAQAAAQTKYADYDVVVEAAGADIPQQAKQIIAHAKDGAELLYHIAKDPKLVGEFAGLNAVEAAIKLGEVRAELRTRAKAPAPVPEPITTGSGGGRSSGEPDPRNTEAWIAWRKKQITRQGSRA